MIGRKQPPIAAETKQGPKGFDAFEVRLGDIMRGERATMAKSLLDVQRELKIKAAYIAAIENADPTAFDTPGFIAGYVRSYARYLGLDPEWAYTKFCQEGKFATVHGMDAAASSPRPTARKIDKPRGDPLSDPNASFVPRGEALLSRIEPGAIGSVLVLLVLIGALGYGGWSVLNEIQQVRLAPVDQAPGVIAEIDPLSGAGGNALVTADSAGVSPSANDVMDRLYRPQPLDVPLMVARDAPIATLRPGALGALAEAAPQTPQITAAPTPEDQNGGVQVVSTPAPDVVIFATRPAWVRVSSADGTVLLEKVLDAGERFVLPKTEEPPLLRTGYAGAIYFAVNGHAYGPAGKGAEVVKNITLGPDALKLAYQAADLTKNPELASMVAQLTQVPTE